MLWEVPEKREKLKELDHTSLKCIMNNNINCYLILFWWIKYCVSEMLHYEMLCATCHNFVQSYAKACKEINMLCCSKHCTQALRQMHCIQQQLLYRDHYLHVTFTVYVCDRVFDYM